MLKTLNNNKNKSLKNKLRKNEGAKEKKVARKRRKKM